MENYSVQTVSKAFRRQESIRGVNLLFQRFMLQDRTIKFVPKHNNTAALNSKFLD